MFKLVLQDIIKAFQIIVALTFVLNVIAVVVHVVDLVRLNAPDAHLLQIYLTINVLINVQLELTSKALVDLALIHVNNAVLLVAHA